MVGVEERAHEQGLTVAFRAVFFSKQASLLDF